MTLTDDDIRLLAWQARRARPHGARQWDEPGIAAQVTKVRHLPLADVMMAVGRAARDRSLETPAAIGNLSAPCWIERPIERPQPAKTTPATRCGICSHDRHDGRCPKCPAIDDHTGIPDFKTGGDPTTTARIAEALRQEVQPLRTTTTDDRGDER